MPICLKNKLTFVHIPKTAGTSIEKALNIQHPECLYKLNKHNELPVCPQHMFLSEIINECEFTKKYTTFTVVRNPFDRLVSEFLFYEKTYWAKDYHKLDFEEFVHVLIHLPDKKRRYAFDGHLEPQHFYLDYKLPIHIFKFENLQPLEEWLSEKTSNTIKLPYELRNTSRTHYSDYYSLKTLKKVTEFYKKDLELFKYKF
jgi:hypothetical protein